MVRDAQDEAARRMNRTEESAAAHRLFSGDCSYVLAASEAEHFDSLPRGLPEIAFWGRSNVGKSSLINALTGRKTLARTSGTPGRTRQIVFFNLGGKALLVDLPGYGYAKAPKSDIRAWDRLIEEYFARRRSLRRVFLLIDARRGIMEADEEKMRLLDRMAVHFQLVLTKTDKAPNGEASLIEKKLKKHPAAWPHVLATSAEKGKGIEAVRTVFLEGL